MPITIELPGVLQPFAGGRPTLELRERHATVADVMSTVASRWPGVRDRVLDEQGVVRPHVNIFVDNESIRFLGGLDAPVGEHSTIVIVPAVSGG
jgi:molybdopterin converting factor small subunit